MPRLTTHKDESREDKPCYHIWNLSEDGDIWTPERVCFSSRAAANNRINRKSAGFPKDPDFTMVKKCNGKSCFCLPGGRRKGHRYLTRESGV